MKPSETILPSITKSRDQPPLDSAFAHDEPNGAGPATLARATMRDALRAAIVEASSPVPARPASAAIEWNALCDVAHMHDVAEFKTVLHIFNQEWLGIRAAAGSLPGGKMAISARPADHDDGMDTADTATLARMTAAYDKFVFHGLSDNTARLLQRLSDAGLTRRIFLVMHGAPTQWCNDDERRLAFLAMELLRSDRIAKLHFLKAGFIVPDRGYFKPMLFNLSPRPPVIAEGDLTHAGAAVAFVPGMNVWRKNVHANIIGAALSSRVDRVVAYCPDVKMPAGLGDKLRLVTFTDRMQTFAQLKSCAICLNVSIEDCHPMINLEAQAIGRPCLRRNLFLDALDEHEYVALTTVQNTASFAEIRDAVDRVLQAPPKETEAMTRDYQRQSDAIAIDRYREFLEL